MKWKFFNKLNDKKGLVGKRKNLVFALIAVLIISAVPIISASFLSMNVYFDNDEIGIFEESIELNTIATSDEKTLDTIELLSCDESDDDIKISYTLSPLSPPVTIDKKVRVNSDDPWGDSITAHIGWFLQFQIKVKNTKLFARYVAITDLFPSLLDYVYGSANPSPNEYFNETEEGLIWLLKVGGLSTVTITFKAKIVDTGFGKNYVVVAPLTGEDADEDEVPIYSTNDPPNTPSTPEGPTELLPNEEGEYCTSATDPDGDKVSIRFDWDADGSHDYSDWSGLVTSGSEICMDNFWESSGQYTVKAQSKDQFGNSSDWSNGLTVIVNNPPNTPSNPDPEDEATNVDTNSDLSWTCNDPDGDELTYDLYFGTSNPPPLVAEDLLQNTYVLDKLEGNTDYYWKIIAWDTYGADTEGPVWEFTTENNPPNTPNDPDPNDGQINVEINTDLSWSGGDPDGDDVTYNVFFEKGDSSPDILVSENQSATTYDPGTLDFGTTYYWQIVSYDSYGASTNGPIWSFTTQVNNPPNTPSNPDPSDGATNVDINTNISWTCSDPDEHLLSYDVYFEAGDSSPDVLVSSNQSETSYNPYTLDFSTTYYWQIIAWDEYGASTNGPIWEFTTQIGNETIYPTDYDIVRGFHISGDLSDIKYSDDSYLVIEPGITTNDKEPPVWLRVFGTSTTSNPSELSFKLESYVTVAGEISQTIELYNYDTEKYEIVDSRQVSTYDEVVQVVITDNVSSFIDSSTLEMKAQIKYIPTGIVSSYPWWIKFDQTIWNITL